MATQNIIQYLETTQYNALPSGGTVPVGIEAMNRRQIETFISGGAIVLMIWYVLTLAKLLTVKRQSQLLLLMVLT